MATLSASLDVLNGHESSNLSNSPNSMRRKFPSAEEQISARPAERADEATRSLKPVSRGPLPSPELEQREQDRVLPTIEDPVTTFGRLKQLPGSLTVSLAMDLGTKNTLIYAKNKGILLNEPSMVAVDTETGRVTAVGAEAENLYGRSYSKIRCVRPLRDGVIANFDLTAVMIREFLKRTVGKWRLTAPRLVIGVPSSITQVERRAVIEAAAQSGVKMVHLITESTAAAIGVGLPVDQPFGSMVVDIGGGTSEVAVLSMNGVVYSESIRIAGDHMDAAIQRYVRRKHHLLIGIQDAEKLKVLIGSALPFKEVKTHTVTGRDVRTSLPSQVEISSHDIYEALELPVSSIVSSVKTALESCSAEIATDIISGGIFLAGGGALLKGLGLRIEKETGIKVYRAEDPLSCVVRGVGRVVDRFSAMKVFCTSA